MTTTLLPRVDYANMRKDEAKRTWQHRRDRTAIMRYGDGFDPSSAEDELFAALDRISDEQLQRYLEYRRVKSGSDSTMTSQYSKSVNDRALQYCKKKKQLGETVDYAYALDEIRRGNIR